MSNWYNFYTEKKTTLNAAPDMIKNLKFVIWGYASLFYVKS